MGSSLALGPALSTRTARQSVGFYHVARQKPPYVRRFANITFYVNCDAKTAEELGADETGAAASPGEEGPPTGACDGGGPKDEPPAPVEGPPADAWAVWGTCCWRIDPGGTLWIVPRPGQPQGEGDPLEVRVPWHRRCGEVKAVRVVGTVRLGRDATGLFCGMSRCERMDLAGLDTSRVTDMSRLFDGCTSLAALDTSGWDTSAVRDMRRMFWGCRSLAALDVSAWDTSQAEDLRGMFCGCSSLSFLDLSGWDMSGALDVSEMFRSCAGLSGVRLGARFSFRPHEPSRSVWLARLPDPPAGPPYGGGWAMEGGSYVMGATELATRCGPALAGTWVWARGRGRGREGAAEGARRSGCGRGSAAKKDGDAPYLT